MSNDFFIDVDPLTKLQVGSADILKSKPYFSDIPVISEKSKDIENEMSQALGVLTGSGGKNGIAVIIITPALVVDYPNKSGPYFDSVDLRARVMENPMINQAPGGTQKPASEVAMMIAGYLHHEKINGSGECMNVQRVAVVADSFFPDYLIYEVTLKTAFGLKRITE